MTEGNISRAATRLGLSQPTVSRDLNKLRYLLGDELFVRTSSGTRPTSKALQLAETIRGAIYTLEQMLLPEQFNPAEDAHTFHIAISDLPAMLMLPPLLQILEREAPKVNLQLFPHDMVKSLNLLDEGKIDFLIGSFSALPERFGTQFLYKDDYVCAMRSDHPLAKDRFDLEAFLSARHMLVSLSGEATGYIDRLLRDRSLSRHVVVTINQFNLIPNILKNTDLICTTDRRVVEMSPYREHLIIRDVPLEIDNWDNYLVWHSHLSSDSAADWMRRKIADIWTKI
jgi:DNA-binding transcriptional LysR family regulator